MTRRAHVVGAGLAGLSAAVDLVGRGFAVTLWEAAVQAGGRCRSYHDPQLDRMIDNGNHLVLSGNRAVARYLATIGASDRLRGPDTADYAFVDRRSGARWQVRPNDGRLPWWPFARRRRVPGTAARDYLGLAALLRAKPGETVADRVPTHGPLWDRLLEPILLAALNTAPAEGSATLTAAVIRESIARGGRAMRPRIAEPTLAAAFVDPALGWLTRRGARIRFGGRLRTLRFEGERLAELTFTDKTVPVENDAVVLAVPAAVAAAVVPDLIVPNDYRAIVNAHFAVAPPAGTPSMIGVVGGLAEWIFAFPDRLSVTVSAADRLVDRDRADLAAAFWADIAAVHGIAGPLPPWQIVKEKRATFAATPAQDARRPAATTRWRSLFLAGDWTQTGLPATIEGALRSGVTAARLAADRS